MIARVGRLAASLLALSAGCYAPSAIDGVECGAGGTCPAGQRCDSRTNLCVRMLGPQDDAAIDSVPIDPIDAVIDAPPSSVFVDEFTRNDSPTIGNGWIEKNGPVYSITNQQVVRIASDPQSYRDNIVYRPASEDVTDVEVSILVRFNQTPPRFAQIFVRARSASITAADSYDSYLLYVDGVTVANRVVLGRQLGGVFVMTLSAFTLSESLDQSSTYRLTLRAEGTSSVALVARVERLEGGNLIVIGSTTASDDTAMRISEAGTVGFGGDEVAAYSYDEFRRTAL